jgi:guanylate kinase
MGFQRRGVMLVIASPSGAGKTSISRAILQKFDNISLSISVTTRARRSSEAEGVHYFFVDKRRFVQMRDDDELLEWAEVHGNFYGTPRADVDQKIAAGHDVMFDIDWQGTQQLTRKCRPDMCTVFVLPPSIAALRSRLETRAQDSDEVIANRLRNAREEMAHWEEYDYVLINEDLEQSCDDVAEILASARLWRRRQANIGSFVADLQAQIDALDI